MQIVIPMAGSGRRFFEEGYKKIKPLIEVDNRPIIEYVVNMFPGETDFVFVCNQEHLDNTKLRETLTAIAPKSQVIGIPAHKRGPVWTVLEARDYINDEEQTIVNYCDFNCVWDYKRFKRIVSENKYSGAMACYRGFHPHLLGPNLYASCRVDESNLLLKVREKYSFTDNKMDSYQSSGTYYFKSGALAKKYFRELIQQDIDVNGEYYVSLVYNLMVRDNLKTYVYEIDKFCQWGTPQDLEEFNYWLNYFKQINEKCS